MLFQPGSARANAHAFERKHAWRGRRRVHTLAEFAACLPQLVPGPHERYPPCPDVPDWARERVAAVMIIETPVDWHQDLQVITDLVRRACHSEAPLPGFRPTPTV